MHEHFLFRANNRKRLDDGIDASEKFVFLSVITSVPRLRSRTLSVTLSDNVKIIAITQCNGRVNSANSGMIANIIILSR